jgi:hypothetical protein
MCARARAFLSHHPPLGLQAHAHRAATLPQAYLVDLVGDEDLAVLPELAKFIGIPAESTNAVSALATVTPKADAAAPTADASAASGENGGGDGVVGKSRAAPDEAPALASSPELAAPAAGPPQTRVMRRGTEKNIIGAAALVRIGAAAANGASTADGKPARSGKATKVTLSWSDEAGDHSVDLPVLRPASELGNPVIDVRSLAAKTGFFTHDPGFTSTSSCESAISFIDGDKGLLMHRGYAIEDLALHCSFPGAGSVREQSAGEKCGLVSEGGDCSVPQQRAPHAPVSPRCSRALFSRLLRCSRPSTRSTPPTSKPPLLPLFPARLRHAAVSPRLAFPPLRPAPRRPPRRGGLPAHRGRAAHAR